jgi:hypothetical protein
VITERTSCILLHINKNLIIKVDFVETFPNVSWSFVKIIKTGYYCTIGIRDKLRRRPRYVDYRQ